MSEININEEIFKVYGKHPLSIITIDGERLIELYHYDNEVCDWTVEDHLFAKSFIQATGDKFKSRTDYAGYDHYMKIYNYLNSN